MFAVFIAHYMSISVKAHCHALSYIYIITGVSSYVVGSSLFLRFRTLSGRPLIEYQWGYDPIQMRGFKALYTFSDQFVDLGKESIVLRLCTNNWKSSHKQNLRESFWWT